MRVREAFPDRGVLRREQRRFAPRGDRDVGAAIRRRLGRQRIEVRQRSTPIVEFGAGFRPREPGLVVPGVERASLIRTSETPWASPRRLRRSPRAERYDARIGQQTELTRNLGRAKHGALVVRRDLQNLLVDRRGLRQEALVAELLGDSDELLDRRLHLPGADVQVAQEVRGVPVAGIILDDAQVFGDRQVELPLTKQLLGVAQYGSPFDWHVLNSVDRIKQRLRPKRSTVRVGVAEAGDGPQVLGRGVALVPVEAVARIAIVQRAHLAGRA